MKDCDDYFVPTYWDGTKKVSPGCSAISTAARAAAVCAGRTGKENGAVFTVEKMRGVRLLNEAWRTVDTSSRLPNRIDQVEVRVEGQPAGDPQKGH